MVGMLRQVGLWISLGVWLLGAGLWALSSFPTVQRQAIAIPIHSAPNAPIIAATLYTPTTLPPPYPLVVVCHGASSTRDIMLSISLEVARHGMAALAYDAGGFGESYRRDLSEAANLTDARIVLEYIQAHPEQFDRDRLGIVGHSMGGVTALDLATQSPDLDATVVLGMQGWTNSIAPPNLLLGIGLYEQFHTPPALRAMLADATGGAIQQPDRLWGNFAQGTARQLVISPTADHPLEPFDPHLVKTTVAWLQQSLGVPGESLPPQSFHLLLGQWLVGVGGWGVVSYGIRGITARRHPVSNRWEGRSSLSFVTSALPWVFLGIALLGWLLEWIGFIPSLAATFWILFWLLLLPWANYIQRYPHQLTPLIRLLGLYGSVIVLSYTVVAVTVRLPDLITQGHFILGIPQFALQWAIVLSHWSYQSVRSAFFWLYHEEVRPTVLWLVWIIPELLRPGIWLASLRWGLQRSLRWWRSPSLKQRSRRHSPQQIGLAIGLAIVLGVILWQRFQSGIVSLENLTLALRVVLRLALVPGGIILWIVRSPGFQRLEQRCFQLAGEIHTSAVAG